jgi:adenylate cyclase
MPNLNQIYSLKQNFSQLTAQDKKIKDYIEKSEAKDIVEKAFDSDRLIGSGSRDQVKLFAILNESINVKPELIKYFDEGKSEVVALLFIDITSFSKTIEKWKSSEIKEFLDKYYREIIPIIYDNGGEIEKLMGDGIICVFGKPFLDLVSPEYIYNAEQCAEDVIKHFYGTDMNVKVAIHKGRINYYKVPGEHYGEYTIIGKPITELYRLESVSKPNAINFYSGSTYDKLGWDKSIFTPTEINGIEESIPDLQGVDYSEIKYIRFPGYF